MKSQCKAKEGEVVITAVRFAFAAVEASARKEFSWAAIQGVKYSPPNDPKQRAMVLLKTTMKGDEDIIITLIGPVAEKNFGELERLKGLISSLRKKGGAPSNTTNSEAAQQTAGAKRPHDALNGVDMKRRRQLLEHDRNLAKQHHDLVVVSKILSEEDFWESYASHTGHFSEVRSGEFRKGKQNSLLSDALASATNGVINLTVELKQNIYAMYPEVRRAYEAEVPLKRNETEFWTAYFQSEYYNAQAGSDSREDSALLRDDLFARYLDPTISAKDQSKRKLGGQLQHSDIDLTASFGDYRPPETWEASDTGAGESAVAAKYNRHSTLVLHGDLAPVRSALAAHSRGGAETQSTGLRELVAAQDPQYIEVRLNQPPPAPTLKQNSGDPVTTGGGASDELKSRCASLADAMRTVASAAKSSGGALPAHLPPPDRANRYFQTETVKLKKQNAFPQGGSAATAGTVGSGRGAGMGANKDIMGMLGIEDASAGGEGENRGYEEWGAELLEEAFQQEMLEAFTAVTELLRHFYTLLNRATPSAPAHSSGSGGASKAGAILERLQEVHAKSLEARKRQVSEAYQGQGERRDAALAAINNVLLLVQRASVMWSIVSNGDGATGHG